MTLPTNRDELLQGCLNGTLDETQERELARLLHESSEARQALRALLRVEGGLLSLGRAGSLDAHATETADCGVRPVPLPRRFPLRRLLLGVAVLAAAAVLLVLALRWFTPNPAVPSPLAIVAHVAAVEGSVDIVPLTGATRAAAVGEPLRAGDTLQTGEGNSVAVVEFADATRLELSPETAIRLPEDGSRSVRLIQGVVRGQERISGESSPLVVTTPTHRVRVEGDRFVLSSASPDSLRVDLEAGRAEVLRQRDQKSLMVESGAALLVQAEVEDMTVAAMPRLVTEPKRTLDFPGAWAVHFEPDGKHFLAASYREIQRFGPDAPLEKTLLSTDNHHGRLATFSADGRRLVVYRGVRKEDPILLWDVRAKEQLARIDARVTDQRLVLAPDGSWLATVDRDESPPVAHVWDGTTGARRFSLPADLRINAIAASPDSKLLAAALMNLGKREPNRILLVNAQTGEEVAVLPTRAYPLTALAFSPDGRYLAAGITGLVQIWDIEKRELVRTIRGFERVLLTLAYSPDGKLLAAGTQDGQVWLWDARSGDEVQVIQAGTSGVRLLTFSPDGRTLATGGIKRHPLMLWEVPTPSQPGS